MRDEELNYSIGAAIRSLNPDARFSVRRKDINDCVIKWYEGTPEISKADIKTEIDKLKAEYDALEWKRKRQSEYPSIEEAVHAILDDDLENLQILRQAVKNKFPKENN